MAGSSSMSHTGPACITCVMSETFHCSSSSSIALRFPCAAVRRPVHLCNIPSPRVRSAVASSGIDNQVSGVDVKQFSSEQISFQLAANLRRCGSQGARCTVHIRGHHSATQASAESWLQRRLQYSDCRI